MRFPFRKRKEEVVEEPLSFGVKSAALIKTVEEYKFQKTFSNRTPEYRKFAKVMRKFSNDVPLWEIFPEAPLGVLLRMNIYTENVSLWNSFPSHTTEVQVSIPSQKFAVMPEEEIAGLVIDAIARIKSVEPAMVQSKSYITPVYTAIKQEYTKRRLNPIVWSE